MRLADPLWLLALIAVAGAALAWVRSGGWRAADTRMRAGAVLAWLGPALVVVALAQPQLRLGPDRPTVLVVDRSTSVDAAMRRREGEWLRRADATHCPRPCRVVQFAQDGRLSAPDAARRGRANVGDRNDTDIAAALRLALGRLPAHGRVVLLSDGQQTTGDALGVAPIATRNDTRIDVVPLRAAQRDAAVTRLQAAGALHAGDVLSVQVTVRSTVAGDAVLSLTRDGGAAARETVRLRAGDNPLLLSLRAPARGWHSYRVRVALPGDRVAQNDALDAALRVTARPRVLVVGNGSSALAGRLAGRRLTVRQVTPDQLPRSPGAYAGEDAVVLSDVSARRLGRARQQALAQAVRAGGLGLVALGGPHAFSLGRYAHTPLERALPVASLKPGRRQRHNVALELVLDRSGSMQDLGGGVPKIQMAQAAARVASAFAARHRDQLGIVSFDISSRVLVPLTRVSPGRVVSSIDARIDGLEADGGTNIYAALRSAVGQIERSHAPSRHIILLTDGVSQPSGHRALIAQLLRDHIAVSAVALGAEANTKLLHSVTRATHGHYYATNSAKDLPRIFTREVRRSAQPVRIRGPVTVTVGAPSPVVRSLVGRSLPPLPGNVVTKPKPGAQVDLLGQGHGHERDPVLAQWQYGLGRVVAWVPGSSAASAGPWSGKSALFNDAVRWAQRGVADPPLAPTLDPTTPARLEVDPSRRTGAAMDLLQLRGRLTPRGQPTRRLSFAQVAPSRYAAAVPGLATGIARYAIAARGGGSARGLVAVPYPAEYRPAPPGAGALGELAVRTGGRVLDATQPGLLDGGWRALWWWVLLAALLSSVAGMVLRLLGPRRDEDEPVLPTQQTDGAAAEAERPRAMAS